MSLQPGLYFLSHGGQPERVSFEELKLETGLDESMAKIILSDRPIQHRFGKFILVEKEQ